MDKRKPQPSPQICKLAENLQPQLYLGQVSRNTEEKDGREAGLHDGTQEVQDRLGSPPADARQAAYFLPEEDKKT